MAYAIRNQLATFGSIQPTLFVEQLIHIHASQLSDAFLLRHAVIEFVYLLFHIIIA